MTFEIVNALRGLSTKTPEYFRNEVWAHGDTTSLVQAKLILSTLDVSQRSARILRQVISLVSEDDPTSSSA